MNLRTVNLKTLTLTAWLLVSQGSAINAITNTSKAEITETYKQKPAKENNSVETANYYDIYITTNTLHSIKEIEIPESTQTVISRTTDDLKETPLFMKWIGKHVGEFLWYSQYKKILSKYNKDNKNKTNIQELEDVKFPLIYDDFRENIEQDLQERLKDEKLAKHSESLKNETELLIIDKDKQNKYFLSYYADNKLILCTYISTGVYSKQNKSIETPKWVFTIWDKISHRRSKSHENAPMAYSLHIIRGVFSHQWTSDGTKRSHGCVRVPGLYQEFLFYHVESGTKIVIL